jgi:hypothetical protein
VVVPLLSVLLGVSIWQYQGVEWYCFGTYISFPVVTSSKFLTNQLLSHI